MEQESNDKDNEQQRRKSQRVTAGKDTRKKYADDTELQQQLARTPTKCNREAIRSEDMTDVASGNVMKNGEHMKALELAIRMGAITNCKLTRPIVVLDESFLDLTKSPLLAGVIPSRSEDSTNTKTNEK